MRVLPYGQRQERSGLDPVLSLVGHRNARHKVTTQDYEGSSYRHSRNIGDGRRRRVPGRWTRPRRATSQKREAVVDAAGNLRKPDAYRTTYQKLGGGG